MRLHSEEGAAHCCILCRPATVPASLAQCPCQKCDSCLDEALSSAALGFNHAVEFAFPPRGECHGHTLVNQMMSRYLILVRRSPRKTAKLQPDFQLIYVPLTGILACSPWTTVCALVPRFI